MNLRLVVQKVMCKIVAHISENTTTEHTSRDVPVPPKYCMRKVPKGRSKSGEHCRRHNEPELVHGKVMVNTVKEEVHCNTNTVIRHVPAQAKNKKPF